MSDGKYSVSLSPEAKEDLRSIAAYISDTLKNKIAARGQTQRIRNEIRALDVFPEKFQLVEWEPWHGMGVRRMPVGNYLVFYLPNSSSYEVVILRIFYGGRDIESIISEDGE